MDTNVNSCMQTYIHTYMTYTYTYVDTFSDIHKHT